MDEDEISQMNENCEDVTQDQEELVQRRVRELQRSNAELLAENDLFERFLSRLDAQDLLPQDVMEHPLSARGVSQRLTPAGSPGRRRRTQSGASDGILQLTLDQKVNVAQREVADTEQDQDEHRHTHEEIKDNYKASLKEAEWRMAEIRTASVKFERSQLAMMKLDLKQPEKILQDIVCRSKSAELENLKMKNLALQSQENKLQRQLQQRKETEKGEHEVLAEYVEQTTFVNPDELRAKNQKAQRVLMSNKEMLNRVTQEAAALSRDVVKRRQKVERVEERIRHVEEEQVKAAALNKHLRRQMSEYQAPAVVDYILLKDKHMKLQQSVHTWERKAAIAEVTLRRHTRASNRQRAGDTGPLKLPFIAAQDF